MCNSLARSAIFRLFLFVRKFAFFLWLFHIMSLDKYYNVIRLWFDFLYKAFMSDLFDVYYYC